MGIAETKATPDFPIHELLAERWSPDVFQDRTVPPADLRSLFEAARWAPSSYNEQPWSYIVATKDNPEEFAVLLSCLDAGNQAWAKSAPVLALGVVSLKLTRNGKLNRAAVHDLGLASSNLTLEATSRGLVVHQMIGILPEKAKRIYKISNDWEVWTALAIGYEGERDRIQPSAPRKRKRKPLIEFVFSGKWRNPSSFLHVAD